MPNETDANDGVQISRELELCAGCEQYLTMPERKSGSGRFCISCAGVDA